MIAIFSSQLKANQSSNQSNKLGRYFQLLAVLIGAIMMNKANSYILPNMSFMAYCVVSVSNKTFF